MRPNRAVFVLLMLPRSVGFDGNIAFIYVIQLNYLPSTPFYNKQTEVHHRKINA